MAHPHPQEQALRAGSAQHPRPNHQGHATQTVEGHLQNAPGLQQLNVSAALSTAWKLFTERPGTYMLWYLVLCIPTIIIMSSTLANFVKEAWLLVSEMEQLGRSGDVDAIQRAVDTLIMRVLHMTQEFKDDYPETMLALPSSLGSSFFRQEPVLAWAEHLTKMSTWTDVVAELSKPLTFGPFLVACNCLRRCGRGFKWLDLFVTGFKYIFPLWVLSVLQNLACSGTYTLVTSLHPSGSILFLAYLLWYYLELMLVFSSCLYLEYNTDGIGILKSLTLSFTVSNLVLPKLVLLGVASAAITLLGHACFLVGAFVATPVVSLAWAVAFNQVFGLKALRRSW